MQIIFLFLIIMSCAGAFSFLFKKEIEFCIPVSVLTIIVVLYLLGLFGVLQAGVTVIVMIGIAGCCYSVSYMLKKRLNPFTIYFTPGVAVYLLFFVLVWVGQRGKMLTIWDEFSHWGLVVKNTYILNSFAITQDATTYFKSYPPALSLLQYFLIRLSGNFNEPDLYRAVNILYFSLALPLFSGMKWKKWFNIAIITAIVLVLPIVFYQDFYNSILVDAILGVMFGYILFCHYSSPMDSFRILNTSLSVIVLSLIKTSGEALSILALIMIATDYIAKRSMIKDLFTSEKHKVKRIILLLLPVLCLLVAMISWHTTIRLAGVAEANNLSRFSLKEFVISIIGRGGGYRHIVATRFVQALTSVAITGSRIKITFVLWLFLLSIPAIFVIEKETKPIEKISFKYLIISIYVGALLYTLSLLLLYDFRFSQYEATNLASYSRYISTYLLGIAVLFCFLFLDKYKTTDHKVGFSAILLFMVLVTDLTPLQNYTVLSPLNNRETVQKRAPYQTLVKLNSEYNKSNGEIYFVSIADKGFDYWVARYSLTPTKLQPSSDKWSIGSKPYYKGDIWTQILDPNQWTDELKNGYSYVYVYKTNDEFNASYGGIFAGGSSVIKANTLYKIIEVNGKVVLQAIQAS